MSSAFPTDEAKFIAKLDAIGTEIAAHEFKSKAQHAKLEELANTIHTKRNTPIREQISTLNATFKKGATPAAAKLQFNKLSTTNEGAYSANLLSVRTKIDEILLTDAIRADDNLEATLNSATNLLTFTPAGPDPLATKLRKEIFDVIPPSLVAAKEKFDDAWKNFPTKKHYPHIINAAAGDLSAVRGSPYRCDATAALRKRCLNNSACAAAEVSSSTKVPKISDLCSRDPYKAYSDPNRGIEVTFACVLDTAENKRELAKHPRIDPATNSRFRSSETQLALLKKDY